MRQMVRLLPIGTNDRLAGYVLERPASWAPSRATLLCHYVVLVMADPGERQPLGIPGGGPAVDGADPRRVALRPVGRLVPVAALPGGSKPSSDVRVLRAVRSGKTYRITSPPARGLMTPSLAEALEAVFERFAGERGFTREKPLVIGLSRGFATGSRGHGEGRAADLAMVGGKNLLEWKREWEQAMAAAEGLTNPGRRAEAIASQQRQNLGYSLYKSLQEHGGWRIDPDGWRPYRGVMQLFGPWTASEGPWKAMHITAPNAYQHQRLTDQQWVFQAHHDHIHVAK